MQRRLSRLASLVVLAALSSGAAAQAFRVPASAQAQQAVASTYVHVAANQKGLEAAHTQSSASNITNLAALPGLGLLDALIIGLIAHGAEVRHEEYKKQAEALVTPMRFLLDDYDLRAKLLEALKARLAGTWLKPARVNLGTEFAFPEQVTGYAGGESAALLLQLRYSLSADFRYFRLWCGAHLIANSESLRAIAAKERPGEKTAYLYRNEVMHIGTFDGPKISLGEAAARWGENGGARLRAVLDEAIGNVADLLAADLGAGSLPAMGKRVSLEQDAIVSLLSESPGRAVIRHANGALWAVPSSVIGPAAPRNSLRDWD
jgi:hypothetical protein